MNVSYIKPLVLSLCLALLTLAACTKEPLPKQAWWLDIQLDSARTELNGLHVSDYRDNWKSASFIDLLSIQKNINASNYDQFINSNFKFNIQYDLNKNGINETFNVGVYKDNVGQEGIFLAVFEANQLVKLFKDSSRKNFSVLLMQGNQLYWYRCMECNDYEQLVWSGTNYFLE